MFLYSSLEYNSRGPGQVQNSQAPTSIPKLFLVHNTSSAPLVPSEVISVTPNFYFTLLIASFPDGLLAILVVTFTHCTSHAVNSPLSTVLPVLYKTLRFFVQCCPVCSLHPHPFKGTVYFEGIRQSSQKQRALPFLLPSCTSQVEGPPCVYPNPSYVDTHNNTNLQ